MIASIIIPHYNSIHTLRRLLNSIPDVDNIEVIVIDDQSDNCNFSEFACERYFESVNISFLINDGKKGAGTCRNIGLDNAHGQWLIFADADDYFFSDALIELIEHLSNCDADLILFPPTSSLYNGNVGFRHKKYEKLVTDFFADSSLENELKLKLTHNVPWSKAVRRDLVVSNNIRFSETIVANDAIFSLNVGLRAKRLSILKNVIYCVTHSNDGLTTTKSLVNYQVRLDVFCEYYSLLSPCQREMIGISGLSILYAGRGYGLFNLIKGFIYLKSRGVTFLKHIKFDSGRVISLIKGDFK